MSFKKFRDFFRISKLYISNAYEVIACFILRRTHLSKVDKNGDTALHRAIDRCDFYKVKRLIKCGADVNAIGKNGSTALHYAALRSDKYEVMRLLAENGANVNAAKKNGITLLFTAVKNNNPEIVALLLKYGADVNAVDKNGGTVLHNAVLWGGRYAVICLLIENGAKVNAVDDKYAIMPLLFSGVERDNPEIVALLLKYGADVNTVNKGGITPLMSAVSWYCWYDSEQNKMRLSIVRVLILATLLDNVNVKKPDFMNGNQSISTLWSDCKVEIEAFLSKVMFNSSSLGTLLFLDLCKEKDENKLARVSQNEEVKKILENVNRNTEKYSYLGEKIQAQFQKGLARNQALYTAFNSVFTFNTNRELNEDCWEEILKKLSQEDLKNVTKVAYLFFKKLPSNDSYNFSSAKQKLIKLEEEIRELEEQIKKPQETIEKMEQDKAESAAELAQHKAELDEKMKRPIYRR